MRMPWSLAPGVRVPPGAKSLPGRLVVNILIAGEHRAAQLAVEHTAHVSIGPERGRRVPVQEVEVIEQIGLVRWAVEPVDGLEPVAERLNVLMLPDDERVRGLLDHRVVGSQKDGLAGDG